LRRDNECDLNKYFSLFFATFAHFELMKRAAVFSVSNGPNVGAELIRESCLEACNAVLGLLFL
jgi:hypothetical protein